MRILSAMHTAPTVTRRPREQRQVIGSIRRHPAVGPEQRQHTAKRMLSLSSTPKLTL